MSEERREFNRITTDTHVQFFEEALDAKEKLRLEGEAQNCSFGGMFISTDTPLLIGSIVRLNFQLHFQTVIQARAVVQWVRDSNNPRGMGVKFIEIEGVTDDEFATWLANLSEE